MWLMNAHFHQGVFFLVLYETFRSVPDAYAEAAKIDGASNTQIMFRVMLPLAKNAFLTIFLLRVVAVWNEYQSAILFIPNKPTIAYGLYYYTFVEKKNTTYSVPMQLTGAFLICVPILVLFVFFQNRIMGNLSLGGLKG
jgi:ABC-type glycerol-3-phosphate transport system permease component